MSSTAPAATRRRAKASSAPPPGVGFTIPPLWGDNSFNSAAGMAKIETAAAFIHANMPVGADYREPILSEQEAWDVAAFMTSQPRPRTARAAPRRGRDATWRRASKWWSERDSNPHHPLARRGLCPVELSSHDRMEIGGPRGIRTRRLCGAKHSALPDELAARIAPAEHRAQRMRGAWGRFRAHLSAFSARRFHQISFPGAFRIGADGGRTDTQRNPGLRPFHAHRRPSVALGTLPLSHVREQG